VLITYSTANLNPKERVVFTQKLEVKYRYERLIRGLEGYRVGRGVMIIPMENLKTVTEHLGKKGVNHS
jgi:hypothetical protein